MKGFRYYVDPDPAQALEHWIGFFDGFAAERGPILRRDYVIDSARNFPRTATGGALALLLSRIRRVERVRPDLPRFDPRRFSGRGGEMTGAWVLRCVAQVEEWLGLPSGDESPGPPPSHRADPPRAGEGGGE